MDSKVTIQDLARALGLSVGTVHRALHGHPGVSSMKKARVVQMAQEMGYRPNLAARYLRSKRNLAISVNTPREIASFYDLVRAGIEDEAGPLRMAGVEIQHRLFSRLGLGEEEAFRAALDAKVDGIVVVPGDLTSVAPWIRRAARAGIPVVSVINEAPGTDKLAAVSVDTTASGALVAELMGRMLQGRGNVGISCGDLNVPNHADKVQGFKDFMRECFPALKILEPIQNHESESEAYDKTRHFLAEHPDICGMYISTGNGTPVLQAIDDAHLSRTLTVYATSLFPALVPRIESGQVVATVFERPYSQARIAFRIMHDFLMNGTCPAARVTLAPLLVMKSNLNRFLQQEYIGTETTRNRQGDAEGSALSMSAAASRS